ncbi:MAG: hypothetical protein ACRCXN_00805, partial [Bacteroidales bacterium]
MIYPAVQTPERFVSAYLYRIAKSILGYPLNYFNIIPVDIECYFYHESWHPDDTAQRHPLQGRYNQFYFYRMGKSNTLRPVNRMGAGIALSGKNYTLAVLLRGIRHGDKYIDGTSKVAAYLFHCFSQMDYSTAPVGERLKIIEQIEQLSEVVNFSHQPFERAIWATVRVGLNAKREYKDRKYRFLIEVNRSGYKGKKQLM